MPKLALQHRESKVEPAQNVHACRGSVTVSHMPRHVTHSVWAFCWALGLLQRTAAHPPLAMLQDLQVPSHACSSNRDARSVSVGTSGTVCVSVLLVAVQEAVLCLGFWPRADSEAEDLTGRRAVCSS